jgi:choline dehydrogenase-like flavoprotein
MATIFAVLLNEQSEGSVVLQSADPQKPLLIDPNFFSHPYDRRQAVEMTRELLRLTRHPSFQKDTIKTMFGPDSESEEDILAFWRKYSASTWHLTGTARMGHSIEGAVVDKDFKVFGVDNLRVADMSIYPHLPK